MAYVDITDIKCKGSENVQIAVCDDDKEIRDMFAEKIQMLCPKADLLLYSSGDDLLLSGGQPDILILDIQMPGKNGMETARDFRRNNKRAVLIFVTILEDYVFQAFDVGAFHYLVKPFDDKKFTEVLEKAVEQIEDMKGLEAAEAKGEQPKLMITSAGKHIIVNLKDIVYAEVFNRKVIIHTMNEDIEYYGQMKELQTKAGEDFYRTHRAYLVNFNFIIKYDSATIYLKKGQALMAKQNYRDFVKCYLRYNRKKERKNDR